MIVRTGTVNYLQFRKHFNACRNILRKLKTIKTYLAVCSFRTGPMSSDIRVDLLYVNFGTFT